MNCEKVQSDFFTSLYSDSESLPNLDEHLRVCPSCREATESMRLAFDALSNNFLESNGRTASSFPTSPVVMLLSERIRRSDTIRRRWRATAAISAVLTASLMIAGLFVSRVELNRTSLSIRWGKQERSETIKPDVNTRDMQLLYQQHDRKLKELDLLVQVVVDEIQADEKQLAQVALTLAGLIQSDRELEEERWRTVSRGMHKMHLTRFALRQTLKPNEIREDAIDVHN